MTDAGTIQRDAETCATEPTRSVTHNDVKALYATIAGLASVVGSQSRRITELEARKPAGRPPKPK